MGRATSTPPVTSPGRRISIPVPAPWIWLRRAAWMCSCRSWMPLAPGVGPSTPVAPARCRAGVAVDGSGNVYTIGNFSGTADFDPGTGTVNLASAGARMCLCRSWMPLAPARQLGGTADDFGWVAVDGSGNVTPPVASGTADFDPGTGTVNLASAGGAMCLCRSWMPLAPWCGPVSWWHQPRYRLRGGGGWVGQRPHHRQLLRDGGFRSRYRHHLQSDFGGPTMCSCRS